MCKNEVCPPIGDGAQYCPLRRYRIDAFDIMSGCGNQIAACNLLAAIECGDVPVDMLPVTLEEIERVAGRTMRAVANLSPVTSIGVQVVPIR